MITGTIIRVNKRPKHVTKVTEIYAATLWIIISPVLGIVKFRIRLGRHSKVYMEIACNPIKANMRIRMADSVILIMKSALEVVYFCIAEAWDMMN